MTTIVTASTGVDDRGTTRARRSTLAVTRRTALRSCARRS